MPELYLNGDSYLLLTFKEYLLFILVVVLS